jgi:RNA polymerase sigma-70 factor, ECF subfamily
VKQPVPADNSPTDEALMAAVAAGDSAALEVLFDRYAGWLLAVCRAIVHDHQGAEDVVAQVFWEIWHQADRYDASRSSARAYLVMVVRSRALDLLRSHQSRRRTLVGPSADSDVVALCDERQLEAVENLSLQEDRQRVREAMADLSPDERQALELAFFQGLTHREIADALNSPLGTVKGRIRHALQKLRKALRGIAAGRDR